MYINMNKILDKFSKFVLDYKISFNSEILNFKFSTKILTNYSEYCLYIFKAKDLPNNILINDKINFLIIGNTDKNYLNKYNYIILKENSISIFDIIKTIQDLLDFDDALASFKEKLLSNFENNFSLQNIISTAYEYLNNPIIILNSKYQTCYFEIGKTNIDEPVWKFQLENGYPNPKYSLKYNYNKKNRLLAESSYEPIITYFEDIMKYREITIPIKHIDFVIGRISILEINRDITPSDIHILKTIAKLIYPLMIKDKKFNNINTSKLDTILCELIDNKSPNLLFIKKQLSDLKFNLDSNMYMLCLNDFDRINSKSKINYIRQIVQNSVINHYTFIYQNNIIILYNNKNSLEPFYKAPEYNNFINVIKNYTLNVGVSKLFKGLSNMRNAYFESLSAINFGTRIHSNKENPKFIYFYNDYVIHDLVYDFVEKHKLHYIFDSTIKELFDENNTDLITTVKSYINNNGNLNLISKELGIHYNTLKYRIDKLKNKYSIDLKNSDILIKLMLSLVALEISETYNLKLE